MTRKNVRSRRLVSVLERFLKREFGFGLLAYCYVADTRGKDFVRYVCIILIEGCTYLWFSTFEADTNNHLQFFSERLHSLLPMAGTI